MQYNYPIVETYKGENFHGLVRKLMSLTISWRQLSQNAKTYHIGVYSMPKFRGENFHRWRQSHEIRECFLP